VGNNEIPPGGLLVPVGRQCDPVSAKNVSHRLIRDGMAEIAQSSDDVLSPTGILCGEADKRLHFGRGWGPASVFGDQRLVPGIL